MIQPAEPHRVCANTERLPERLRFGAPPFRLLAAAATLCASSAYATARGDSSRCASSGGGTNSEDAEEALRAMGGRLEYDADSDAVERDCRSCCCR